MAQKMKNCKACGQEIAKSAKVCPHCGAKQKGKKGLIVIGIIVLLIIILLATGGNGDKESKIDNSAVNNDSAATEETTKDTEATVEDEFVKVGGSFEDNGLKFTVNDADLDFQITDDEYGLYDLDEGLHYIKVDFTFENTGSSGDKYVSIYDFDCYADNTTCEQQYVTSVTGDFMNANLSPGRNVSFSILFAVPDGAESIELEYTSNIWSDEKVVVKLQ